MMKHCRYFVPWLVIIVCSTNVMHAQVYISVPVSKHADPVINIYGAGNLAVSIPYEKVKGSPFWKDDWQMALLVADNAHDKWFCRSRLNLATSEVYFLDRDSQELVANTAIRSIVFYKGNDTSEIDESFNDVHAYPDLIHTKELSSGYLQVMNQGKYQLLKFYKRTVSSADSMFGTLKRYYFTTQYRYFVSDHLKTEPLKKLNKENLLPSLPGSSSFNDWIAENKIDFRKEDDAIKFLDYYNSKNQ